MSSFAYLLPFVSVIVGLAVTNLLTSLHRLLRARRRVTWDWLPLAAGLFALLCVLDLWWGFYGFREKASWTFAGFLPWAAVLVLLFLVNAAALPDDVPPEGLDLEAFYESNRPYFWSLFIAYFLVINARKYVRYALYGRGFSDIFLSTDFVVLLVLLGINVALVFVRSRLFHAVTVVALLVLFALEWSGRSIGIAPG